MTDDLQSSGRVSFRAVTESDEANWREMWAAYCAFYKVTVPEAVTAATWGRILDPAIPIGAILAVGAAGDTLGFANYVLHPHTWSEKTLCYLEDLFVLPEARGKNVGHGFITHLVAMGRTHDWNRVYWHTNADNAAARRLYDRFSPADDYVRYVVSMESASGKPE